MDLNWQMDPPTGMTYSENMIKPSSVQGKGQGHLWGHVQDVITTKLMLLAPVARPLGSI